VTAFATIPNGIELEAWGIAADRELARRSLCEYAQATWPSYQTPPHIQRIAEALERVERGECRRLIICCPPRHGKSMLTSEFFPAWYLGRHPDRYVIHATYAQDLSDDFGRKVRNQCADPQYREIFADARLADDSQSVRRFSLSPGGTYYAVGVGGPVTGRGAHVLLIDDPIKGREEADSETMRRRLKDWYRSVAYTRLMPGGAVVIIETRWHHDDLAGWLLREHEAEGWEVLSLPAIAVDGDPIGRQPGEALWPEQYPAARLAEIREQLGSREWSALYQQDPMPEEGAVFRIDWFRRWRVRPDFPRVIVHSWDTGIKPEQIHDPSVCQTWIGWDRGYALIDQYRRTMAYPDLKRAVVSLAERDHPTVILIEDKGSGQSLGQDLRESTRLPVIMVVPQGSKIFRAQRVSPIVEAGHAWVPESAPWMPEWEAEVAQFPAGAHDDQVDAMTQALDYLRDRFPIGGGLADEIPIVDLPDAGGM